MATLTSELINQVNSEIVNFDEMDESSTDFTEKAIPFINRAIDFLSDTLISFKDPLMVAEITISNSLPVMSDFVQFAPSNGYLVYVAGGVFYTLDGNPCKVKYYSRKPRVTDVTQVIPFPDCYTGALIQIVEMFLRLRSEEGMANASALLEQVLAAIKAAKA